VKKSKKDIFRRAVADNLNEHPDSNSELGDFVNDMKRGQPGEEKPSKPQESKNDLPEQKEEKETGTSMESRLKRLTSGPSQPAAFDDDDEPPRWRRPVVVAVVAILVAALIYWAIFAPAPQPTIYLSNGALEESAARNLPTTNLVFPRGKTIYLLFSNGGRLGQDKLITKLTEVYVDSSNISKEEGLAQIEGSVKSTWRYFTAQFQKENFERAGHYRIHVMSPNGEVLASQEFHVK
jgi:hypothetical protein